MALKAAAARITWSAWDDNDTARRHAETKGLPLTDPWSRHLSDDDTLLIVTPRDAAALGQRLTDNNYIPDKHWLHLTPPA